MSAKPTLGSKVKTGVWGRHESDAASDRDEAVRKARGYVPSTSHTLARCSTCSQWGSGLAHCAVCGEPWAPAELVGLEPVVAGDAPHRR